MAKQVAPNGCAFCEIPQPSHGPRIDGLHPVGQWTWVEPSDSVRLQRMKRNRQIRKGFTMGIASDLWIDATIEYKGKSRPHLCGVEYTVSKVSVDGKSVMFRDEYDTEQWVAASAVEVIAFAPAVEAKPLSMSPDLLDPHAETISAIDAEIKRLTERLAELRTARQVISGL